MNGTPTPPPSVCALSSERCIRLLENIPQGTLLSKLKDIFRQEKWLQPKKVLQSQTSLSWCGLLSEASSLQLSAKTPSEREREKEGTIFQDRGLIRGKEEVLFWKGTPVMLTVRGMCMVLILWGRSCISFCIPRSKTATQTECMLATYQPSKLSLAKQEMQHSKCGVRGINFVSPGLCHLIV